MRLIGAAILALLIPAAAIAQYDPGETPTQQEFRQSVEALPSTPKRRAILRAEGGNRRTYLHRGHHGTTGAGGTR